MIEIQAYAMKTNLILTVRVLFTLFTFVPTGGLPAQNSTPTEPRAQGNQDLEIDKEHFRQIFKAIQAYRQDHNDELPDWLSDLFPKYLTDENLLISSLEQRTGTIGPFHIEDPRRHTSYNYEFNATPASRFIPGEEAEKMTMKQWKTKQRKSFGPVTPIVRFIWSNGALNLAYSGDIYETQIPWETDPRTLALVKELREKGQVAAPTVQATLPLVVNDAESGKPIAGAVLQVEVQNEIGWQPLQVLTTDVKGKAQAALPDGKILAFGVNVSRKGYASTRQGYNDASEIPKDLVIVLDRAMAIGGLVQDTQKRPIAGARVSLFGNEAVTTDASGRWSYESLPQGSRQFAVEISHPDYRTERVQSSDTNMVAALKRKFSVKGAVKDATTGQPIEAFNVISGSDLDRGVQWSRARRYPAREGQFTLRFAEESPNYLKVLVGDYLPAISRHFSDTEENVELEFALTKGARVTGRVVSPDGQARPGAQVALLTESSTALLSKAELISRELSVVTTDSRGNFAFAPDPEACSVIVADNDGFAEVPIEEINDARPVSMKQWSRLTAELRNSRALVRGNALLLVTADAMLPQKFQGPYLGRLALDFNAFVKDAPDYGQTYEFDRIPPGERLLWRATALDPRLPEDQENVTFAGVAFEAKPGETTKIKIGENTGTVKGRVRLLTPTSFSSVLGRLSFKLPGNQTTQERWLTLNSNGQFRMDDLPDSLTDLELAIFEPPVLLGTVPNLKLQKETLGSPFPDLDLQPLAAMALRDTAPECETQTLDGRQLNLTDFRGRHVLVEFWSSWCNSGLSSVPHLRAVIEKYGQKIAVVGLNLDNDPALAKRFIDRLRMNWPQGFLGHWSRTSLPAKFGARSLPAAFLFDPEGRLDARNVSGCDMLETIERAVGKSSE
jgi:thiol-disulfide isomerase/thioredoxin